MACINSRKFTITDFTHMARTFFLPSHLGVILRDIFKVKSRVLHENDYYIKAAAEWMARAQDATADDGVSAAYSMIRGGWQPSYFETTGYIIEMMFDYADYSGQEEYRNRGIRMANWLVSCQMEDGAFQGGTTAHRPIPRIFNTGQIMIGLLRAYRVTGDNRYLASLKRAGDWLVAVQDESGCWARFNLWPERPTYNTRVAWPLLGLGLLTNCERYVQAARKFLDWAVSRQLDNGWVEGNEAKRLRGALTHFAAYTASGFLECGKLLDDSSYIAVAQRFCEAILEVFCLEGKLFATYDRQWRSCYHFSCLTGNAQIAILWFQLYGLLGDDKYFKAGVSTNLALKAEVDLQNKNPGVCGALKGASPIWGHYIRFAYPNWATKFLLDALLLEERIRQERSRSTR